jgi:DNA-binding SARP family transcriptional activator
VPAKIRVPSPQALPRERLEARLREALGRRLTLVIAPAGSGKTTLVARLASTCGVPVGWYRAEALDADEGSFVRHLEAALVGAIPGLPGDWATVEDAARNLEARAGGGPVLLIIDDLYALEATPAEAAFGRLVDYAPPWLSIVVASRVLPGVNLTRLRIAGELLELGPDDLRFRAWEVEQLFREVYHDPVPPADLAVLASRTEGWAAGLQLYHLATRGKPVEERRRVLTGAGSSVRLVREYLASNVLSELPEALRRFLLDTCVLGRLSGPLCDELRGSRGSAEILEDLSRRGVFTVPVEDADDVYRYHEVLRQHLDRMLVDEVGEQEARSRHATAGALLEAAGALPEALRAYCRAEDWDAVRRLLGRQGERLAAGTGAWVDAVPPAIERHDPWVALASARRARNEGRWATALDAYGRAVSAFGPAPAADIARRERRELAAWLDPTAIQPSTVSGLLRGGLIRDPGTAARELSRSDDPGVAVARGLLALAAGEVTEARRMLEVAAGTIQGNDAAGAAARLGAAIAAVLGGASLDRRAIDLAVDEAERAGVPWLARLARGLGWRLEADGGDGPAGDDLPPGTISPEDPWSEGLLALAEAWTGTGDPEDRLASAEAAASRFRRIGAGVLEAWARGLAAVALAEAGRPDARDAALAAESLGRATGTPASRLLAYAAIAVADADRRPEFALMASTLAADIGMTTPLAAEVVVGVEDVEAAPGGAVPGMTRIRTFGGFGLDVDGRRVPLDGAKPRVRALLRLLAMHAGAPVHREVIQEALWPEADAAAGARSLHVAVSSLRRLLDEVAAPIGGRLVVRDGDAYRLDVPPVAVDLGRFEHAMAEGRAARARNEVSAAAFGLALELYKGDLLPEDGPAEWVAEPRDRYRQQALEAAQGMAEEAMLAGDFALAVRACRIGLGLDRYQDALWRILIQARERAGDAGAAARDRREYATVLEGLGVQPPAAATSRQA